MAKGSRRSKGGDEPVRRRGGFFFFVVRFSLCVFLSIAILYAGLLVMSRTDGFKFLITEQIRPVMGVPTRLAKARLDSGLNLHLEGLICRDAEQLVAPSLYVSRMTITWDLGGLLDRKRPVMKAIDAEGFDLTLAEDLDGVWRPKPLGLLSRIATTFDDDNIRGSLRSALTTPPSPPSAEPAADPDPGAEARPAWQAPYFDVPVTIRKGTLAWLDKSGEAWAEINRFNLVLKPDADKKRRLMHCVFDSGQIITPKDIGLASLEVEFMFSTKGLIMLGYQAPLPQYNASRFRQAAQVFSNQVARAEGVFQIPDPDEEEEPRTADPAPAARVPGTEGKQLLQFTPEELERYIDSVIREQE